MSARRNVTAKVEAAAAGLLIGEDAVPSLGCAVRLSYVGHTDRGARDVLWPDMPILVQPCDQFIGAGFYQMLTPHGVAVRRCFQANLLWISVIDRSQAGAPAVSHMTPDAFAEDVFGLVVAQLGILNDDVAAEMLAKRQVLA